MNHAKTTKENLDAIVAARLSPAFSTFEELLNAAGGYRPSLNVRHDDLWLLANAYDAAQSARGDSRRAHLFKA